MCDSNKNTSRVAKSGNGWRVVDIAFDVNLAHDVYISPRVVTPDSLNHPVWRETQFLRAAFREGIPI